MRRNIRRRAVFYSSSKLRTAAQVRRIRTFEFLHPYGNSCVKPELLLTTCHTRIAGSDTYMVTDVMVIRSRLTNGRKKLEFLLGFVPMCELRDR